MDQSAPDMLEQLANAAGLAGQWRDVTGRTQQVSRDALEAILAALGHPCGDDRQRAESLAAIARQQQGLPAMLVADAGQEVALPQGCRRAEATGSEGVTLALALTAQGFIAPANPGYYALELDGRRFGFCNAFCRDKTVADPEAWPAFMALYRS